MELIKRTQTGWAVATQPAQQHEETMDVIVPDVSPDVFAVLSVTARCTLEETVLRQGGAEVTGSAEVLVLYTSEEERVCTLRATLPLRRAYEMPDCTEGSLAQTRMEVVTAAASILNPRKLSLRVTVQEELTLWNEQVMELCEDVRGEADEGLQRLVTGESGVWLAAAAVRRLSFTEELRLHGEAAEGGLLLRSEAAWQTEEVRVIANRLVVRGTATVRVVTVTEQGAFGGIGSYTLPFSQTVECPRAEPGDRADVTFVTTDLDCRLVSGEDGPRLSVALGGTVAAQVWREQRVQAVSDLYSTRYRTSFETDRIALTCPAETVVVREDYAEIGECAPVAQVCDWSYCARAEGLPEGGTMVRFWFRVLCRMTDGCLHTVCRRADVAMAQEGPCAPSAENVRISPAEGGLAICFTACAAFTRPRVCGLRQVCACALDRKAARPRPEPGTLLLRAAAAEETVWSIAKQYGVPPELLRAANKLGADAPVTPGQLIVVPFAG